jgi:hypothetical protein
MAIAAAAVFVCGALAALPQSSRAGDQEASTFAVPSGVPDPQMAAAAAYAKELDPSVDVSFWDAQPGALSGSRVTDGDIHCFLRLAPNTGQALSYLGRFLNGRIDQDLQALFAVAHEVGHCKMRDMFLKRADGKVADVSAFPWVAQEVAADAYGILSTERKVGRDKGVRQAVMIARALMVKAFRDLGHASGYYLTQAFSLCDDNATDADAVRCAIVAAYYTVGSIALDAGSESLQASPDAAEVYRMGQQRIAQTMRVFDSIAEYKAEFAGADLSRFDFREVSHHGGTRYIVAALASDAAATYKLADFYGFKTGELSAGDRRVTVMRIDGDEEFDWLLTLGAVVKLEDGDAVRKGSPLPGD